MKKYLLILLLVVFIIPSVALASWWNPFSWKIFHKKEVSLPIIPPAEISFVSNPTPIEKTDKNLLQDSQQDQINALKREIDGLKNQKQTKQTNVVSIVNQWRPRIAYIDCSWYGYDGLIEEASGSGVLGPVADGGDIFILTNKHVISNNKSNPATECKIKFPNISDIYTITADLNKMAMEDISFDENYDYGNILIKRPTKQIISLANSKYTTCTKKVNVGEQVLILGYPGIGSSNDITVTEGIISGHENGYYITSAKVEHGNSGGAAILVKDNCYLGIPSYAYSGEIESLARILDLSASAPIWNK